MKTIAISIDEPTLAALDRMATRRPKSAVGARTASRSSLVREALHEFVMRKERAAREATDRAVFARHRDKLRTQAAALVAEQAEP